MVVSVIMYNCSSWAAPKNVLEKLDVCHRRHLRQLLNIKYPTNIRNEKLYEICNTTKLSTRVKIARWKMFGHVLRSPQNSPAALALHFAVEGCPLKGRRGAHRKNLLKELRDDIDRIPIDRSSQNPDRHYKLKLNNSSDIAAFRNIAGTRNEWDRLLYYVV